jgi:hypothetical protein
MAAREGTEHEDESGLSAGSRVAALVRVVGEGTADLTEELADVGGAALARAVRVWDRAWGDVVGMTIDGVAVAVGVATGRRPLRPAAQVGRRPGARTCIDLVDLEDRATIDRALTEGLAAATPPDEAAVR